jgi:hypothetical protein
MLKLSSEIFKRYAVRVLRDDGFFIATVFFVVLLELTKVKK